MQRETSRPTGRLHATEPTHCISPLCLGPRRISILAVKESVGQALTHSLECLADDTLLPGIRSQSTPHRSPSVNGAPRGGLAAVDRSRWNVIVDPKHAARRLESER